MLRVQESVHLINLAYESEGLKEFSISWTRCHCCRERRQKAATKREKKLETKERLRDAETKLKENRKKKKEEEILEKNELEKKY